MSRDGYGVRDTASVSGSCLPYGNGLRLEFWELPAALQKRAVFFSPSQRFCSVDIVLLCAEKPSLLIAKYAAQNVCGKMYSTALILRKIALTKTVVTRYNKR